MPTDFASEMAIYDAEQQERKANWPKYIADVVASQQGPSNVPSSSKNRLGEGTAVGNNGNNPEERSRFSEVWKGVKFSRDNATELVGQEPVSFVDFAFIKLLNRWPSSDLWSVPEVVVTLHQPQRKFDLLGVPNGKGRVSTEVE